jgi:UDP-glucose 4-epimerase
MNILITGVAGLLGSRLASWILDNKNINIIGIDDLSGGYLENIDPRVNFFNYDLTKDFNEIEALFKKFEFKIVYHLAAYAAEGLSPFIRKYNYNNNLISSVNLINNSIKYDVDRFVFTSSMAVYGDQIPPFSEDLAPQPIDPYGIAKYAVEQDLKVAYDYHGLKYTIVRPHNVYGVNQNIWDKYRNVLGIWMYQIMNGLNPTIFGDGNQIRAFSYIDDVLKPLWNASQFDNCVGEIINLGGIKSYFINDAARVVIETTGTELKPVYLEERHEAKHAWTTWEKSVDLLGFNHHVDLEEGVSKMWEWVKDQPQRDRISWSQFEIDKKIYSYWKK